MNAVEQSPSVFAEDLPDGCPPADAYRPSSTIRVIRMVAGAPVPSDAFLSHSMLGLTRPKSVSECDWSSCSVHLERENSGSVNQVKQMQKLPKIRGKKHAAILEIDGQTGYLLNNAGAHCHFWMFGTFDPFAAIVKVVAP